MGLTVEVEIQNEQHRTTWKWNGNRGKTNDENKNQSSRGRMYKTYQTIKTKIATTALSREAVLRAQTPSTRGFSVLVPFQRSNKQKAKAGNRTIHTLNTERHTKCAILRGFHSTIRRVRISFLIWVCDRQRCKLQNAKAQAKRMTRNVYRKKQKDTDGSSRPLKFHSLKNIDLKKWIFIYRLAESAALPLFHNFGFQSNARQQKESHCVCTDRESSDWSPRCARRPASASTARRVRISLRFLIRFSKQNDSREGGSDPRSRDTQTT